MRVFGVGVSSEILPRFVVPIEDSFPIIVAVYHGEGSPNLHSFLEEFLKEMKGLHPTSDVTSVNGRRSCSCRIRAMIADAKERFTLKGKDLV